MPKPLLFLVILLFPFASAFASPHGTTAQRSFPRSIIKDENGVPKHLDEVAGLEDSVIRRYVFDQVEQDFKKRYGKELSLSQKNDLEISQAGILNKEMEKIRLFRADPEALVNKRPTAASRLPIPKPEVENTLKSWDRTSTNTIEPLVIGKQFEEPLARRHLPGFEDDPSKKIKETGNPDPSIWDDIEPSGSRSIASEPARDANMNGKSAEVGGELRLVNFVDRLKNFDESAKGLQKEFSHIGGLMEDSGSGLKGLSEDAIETIRKAKPSNGTTEATNSAVRDAVNNKFQTSITADQAAKLRRHLDEVNSFSPSFLAAERPEIKFDIHNEGMVSVKFEWQGARKIKNTQNAILATIGKSLNERLNAVAASDRNTTAELDRFKAKIKEIIPEKDLQISGYDGLYLPAKELTKEEQKAMIRDLAVTGVDLTFVNKKYTSGHSVPVYRRSHFVDMAEGMEKKLKTTFEGKIPNSDLNQMKIAIYLIPADKGIHWVDVTLTSTNGNPAPKYLDHYIREALGKDVFVRKINRNLLQLDPFPTY